MKTVVTLADNYTLVANTNYFSDNPKVRFHNAKTVITEFKKEFPAIDAIWNDLTAQHKVDLLKYYFASKVDFFMYIDCNKQITELPSPISTYPHFEQCTLSGRVVRDTVFFNNSKFSFFRILTQRLVDFIASPAFRNREDSLFLLLNKQLRIQRQSFSVFHYDEN